MTDTEVVTDSEPEVVTDSETETVSVVEQTGGRRRGPGRPRKVGRPKKKSSKRRTKRRTRKSRRKSKGSKRRSSRRHSKKKSCVKSGKKWVPRKSYGKRTSFCRKKSSKRSKSYRSKSRRSKTHSKRRVNKFLKARQAYMKDMHKKHPNMKMSSLMRKYKGIPDKYRKKFNAYKKSSSKRRSSRK